MPNHTNKEPVDDWKPDPNLIGKSWLELAAEDDEDFYEGIKDDIINQKLKAKQENTESQVKIEKSDIKIEKHDDDEDDDDKPTKKAFKKIKFESPIKTEKVESMDESPMKIESPLKDMVDDSPIKLEMESPMKTETPTKSPDKMADDSPGKKEKRLLDVRQRLWASPRRRDAHLIRTSPRVSPRRPNSDLMSPPREAVKRKRDLFKCASPANSIGSPGSDRSSVFSPRPKRRSQMEEETDPEVLSRRQKQIDYGKNTESYRNYLDAVPKSTRSHKHPQTPPREIKYSRRCWDGMVRAWRQQLHMWDPPSCEGPDSLDCLDMTDTMSEVSDGSGSLASDNVSGDNVSEISYPGSGSKLRSSQRPPSTLSLEEFPPLV